MKESVMNLKRMFLFASILFSMVLVSACNRTQYPLGFPKIYPCKVKVVSGGAAVEGVSVKLAASDEMLKKWGGAGATNAEGIATIRCRGFDGAPVGQFKVMLEKRDPPVIEVSPGKFEAGNTENQLNPEYAAEETTPFAFEMTKKQKTVPVFDLEDGSVK